MLFIGTFFLLLIIGSIFINPEMGFVIGCIGAAITIAL